MSPAAVADNTVERRRADDHRELRRRIDLSPGYDDRTLAPVGDAELLARVADRDRRALEVLYERHAGWLLVRLERRCDDPELADLALQDTYVSVWRNAAKWRGDGEVAAWLWGIAVRRLIDHIRAAGRRPGSSSIDDTRRTPRPLDPADPSPTPEEATITEAIDPDLSAAIAALPSELVQVIIATTIDGLTNSEAATLLGIPVGTLKTRARRARKLLQQTITRHEPGRTGRTESRS